MMYVHLFSIKSCALLSRMLLCEKKLLSFPAQTISPKGNIKNSLRELWEQLEQMVRSKVNHGRVQEQKSGKHKIG